MRLHVPANAFAAGDLLINFDMFKDVLKDTMIVSTSRSGSTSEAVKSIELAKNQLGIPCVSICASTKSDISKLADFNIELPWAFDESVCQTRCVTNLYLANLMMIAILSDDQCLLDEIKNAISSGPEFINKYKPLIKTIVNDNDWDKVVILADAELEGIAEEGALAFNEIAQLQSHYYHVLDVRHGPMVLADKKTLVIIVPSPSEQNYQMQLINDFKRKGSTTLVLSDRNENIWGSDYHVKLEAVSNFSVAGIPLIYIPQALSLYKALNIGINPDAPEGLSSWIQL
jgi:glucosamine--fructose-6-phosphate aminotransferase (isomerizing)